MFEQHFNNTDRKSYRFFGFPAKSQKLQTEYLLNQWLLHVRSAVKPSTLQKYQTVAQKHLLPAFGTQKSPKSPACKSQPLEKPALSEG